MKKIKFEFTRFKELEDEETEVFEITEDEIKYTIMHDELIEIEKVIKLNYIDIEEFEMCCGKKVNRKKIERIYDEDYLKYHQSSAECCNNMNYILSFNFECECKDKNENSIFNTEDFFITKTTNFSD